MITETTRRLIEINQEIRNLTTAALTGEISYNTARHKIQELADERERLWAKE